MFIEIGHFAVVLALVLSAVAMVTPIIGLKTGQPGWIQVARQSVTLIFFLISVGMAAMIHAYLNHDYSVQYVMATSNSKLPIFYKVAALWGGHEGSFLLWVWILSAFSVTAVWLHWKTQPSFSS